MITIFSLSNHCLAMLGRYDVDSSNCDSDSGGSDSSGGAKSSSGSSSSSSRSSSPADVVDKMRCLTLNNLLCMDTAADEDQSQAAANGKSKDRIMLAFKKPCCKQRCKRHLTFKMIYTCCITFWSLSKSGQDALLLDQMWVHHFYKGMPLSFLIPPSKNPIYTIMSIKPKALEPSS